MVYQDDCVLSILKDGNILKEREGEVKIPFNSQYGIRIRNKKKEERLVCLYIDGEYLGDVKLEGNDYKDVYTFSNSRSFKFVKPNQGNVLQPDSMENGFVEAHFYTLGKEHNILDEYREFFDKVKKQRVVEPIYVPIYPQPFFPDPYPQQPWITWCSSQTTNNDAVENARVNGIGMCETIPSSVCCNEGATVQGKKSNKGSKIIPNRDTSSDFTKDITLKIKLISGEIESKINYCECGRRVRDKERFCSQCGKKNI